MSGKSERVAPATWVRWLADTPIATSFIGFCLGLTDFYADLLSIDGTDMTHAGENRVNRMTARTAVERPLHKKAALYALALVPPFAIASRDPSLFFAALDTAGTFGILTLFGILPAIMAWSQRYAKETPPAIEPLVPGGRSTLMMMIGGAAVVIALEITERMGAVTQRPEA